MLLFSWYSIFITNNPNETKKKTKNRLRNVEIKFT